MERKMEEGERWGAVSMRRAAERSGVVVAKSVGEGREASQSCSDHRAAA